MPKAPSKSPMTIEEREKLRTICLELPDNFVAVELGSGKGCSTRIIGKIAKAKHGHLYTIDKVDYKLRRRRTKNLPVTFIQGDTQRVEWQDEIHLLWIDALHTYQGLFDDLERWGPFVKKDGFILGHDYVNLKSVRRASMDYAKKTDKLFLITPTMFLIVKKEMVGE